MPNDFFFFSDFWNLCILKQKAKHVGAVSRLPPEHGFEGRLQVTAVRGTASTGPGRATSKFLWPQECQSASLSAWQRGPRWWRGRSPLPSANGQSYGVTGLSCACSLLNANKINCLRVNTFQDLQNLNLLSLYDNKLQTISKGLFAPLQSIQTL